MVHHCRGRSSPQPEVGAHQVSLTGSIGGRVGGCGGELRVPWALAGLRLTASRVEQRSNGSTQPMNMPCC
eukprot:15036583-Alexandrium_andersonii.AAC.1